MCIFLQILTEQDVIILKSCLSKFACITWEMTWIMDSIMLYIGSEHWARYTNLTTEWCWYIKHYEESRERERETGIKAERKIENIKIKYIDIDS